MLASLGWGLTNRMGIQRCRKRQSTHGGRLSLFLTLMTLRTGSACDNLYISWKPKNTFLLYLMDSQPKVLFYGNSLVLAGVQATFKGYAGFEVIALPKPTTERELLAFDASVVVFDMGALESEILFAQMQELPGVLLIGVDPESHEVLLTGQAACSISLEQITQIVRDLIRPRVAQPSSPPANSP